MTAEAARVRRGRKYEQVLDGARDIFLRDGFDGASVDEIARAANVSKATLYSYFPDKRLLFTEVAARQCRHHADIAIARIDGTRPPQEVLPIAGRSFLDIVLSDFGISNYRMSVAEAERFPDLARQFYESGPMIMHDAMVGYLTKARDRGELIIDDIDLAADQFAELCKADLCYKRVFGILSEVTEEQIARVLDGAVATFLARYAPRG
ncbi:TetR family transcriptional regulator [Roseivivax marinus]|uniref:TetR family transcriptional regulator n=1 Tax=Roseivivax marinus TaxID=1379903 RepID=W4HKS0_9RHOB|nr:TetR/AcrR family transcriptional regulator [Roseivivax marinus]ETW13003.1 TetR family transcriptional regulator [Roseivivax marinus]UMA64446.1 TetR/AcrR family transcriptional regulator [Roseivivax marinus]SEL83069.1 transcriptional regulator, TetR family [Roseivivax marinus]